MKNKIMIKYEFITAFSILVLSLAVAINRIFFQDASLAIINLVISLFPTIYILFYKKLYKFKIYLIPILMIFIRFFTSISSFFYLEIYDIVVQLCYDISFALSIFSIYFVLNEEKVDNYFLFKYVPKVVIFVSVFFSIYNLIDNSSSYLYFTNIKYRYLINFSSFFSNRNLFGALLFFGLVSIDYELDNIGKNNKLYIIKIFLLVNLLLTLSRNCIISYIIFYFVSSLMKKKYKRIIVPICLFLIIVIINVCGIRDLMLTYLVRGDELTSGRTDIWNLCIEFWEKSPIIGYGELYISNIIDNKTGVTSMHSWFFKILLNGGIINVLCYIYIIFIAIKKVLFVVKRNDRNGITLFSCMCAIIFYGIFEEINLFEFGLINCLFTTFFILMPNVLYNKYRSDLNE